MEIQIETNVPMPEGKYKPKSAVRLALEKMEVGESFAYDSPNYPHKDMVRNCVDNIQKLSEKRFRTRSTGGTKRRIWRGC